MNEANELTVEELDFLSNIDDRELKHQYLSLSIRRKLIAAARNGLELQKDKERLDAAMKLDLIRKPNYADCDGGFIGWIMIKNRAHLDESIAWLQPTDAAMTKEGK